MNNNEPPLKNNSMRSALKSKGIAADDLPNRAQLNIDLPNELNKNDTNAQRQLQQHIQSKCEQYHDNCKARLADTILSLVLQKLGAKNEQDAIRKIQLQTKPGQFDQDVYHKLTSSFDANAEYNANKKALRPDLMGSIEEMTVVNAMVQTQQAREKFGLPLRDETKQKYLQQIKSIDSVSDNYLAQNFKEEVDRCYTQLMLAAVNRTAENKKQAWQSAAPTSPEAGKRNPAILTAHHMQASNKSSNAPWNKVIPSPSPENEERKGPTIGRKK